MKTFHCFSGAHCAPSTVCLRQSRGLSLELLFERHAARVYNLARRLLRNDDDAEDVRQDVFLLVARHLDKFRGDADVTTWLHRITINAALQHRRSAARRPERTMAPAPEGLFDQQANASPRRSIPVSVMQHMLQRELGQLIEQAVADLPWIYRDVYVLADIQGHSNNQVGRRLCLSLPAVKSRLHRARSMVRVKLAPHCLDGWAS